MRTPPPGLLVCAAIALAATASADPTPPGTTTTPSSTVATLDGRAVTLAEVDARAAGALTRVRQQEYEARVQALDAIVEETVLAREAEARHIPVEGLIATEVTAKLAAPTTAEIDTEYAHRYGLASGHATGELRTKILEALTADRTARARADYVAALRKKYGVKVALEPPRVAVSAGDGPSRGPKSAPITIVEFSDYQCPFCSRGQETIDEVLKHYGDRVRLVFRDFPLDIHPNAEGAARAARCARDQGKYWEMNRAMFANPAKLGTSDLVATAAAIGLDSLRFKRCLDSPDAGAGIDDDLSDGRSYGVTGTPTFFVNGVMIVGARELAVFTRTIDRELERLGQ